MMNARSAGVLLLLLAACDSPSLTAPDPIPPAVYAEWAIAQRNLAPYVGERALSVTPHAFRWVEHGGRLPCPPDPEARYDGCFGPDAPGGPRVEFNASAPTVLRHESGHAILHALGDPRWSCFEHDAPGEANYEPACDGGVRQ